jgi:hypothetical protein
LTLLVLVLWLGLGELLAAGVFGQQVAGIPAAVWATWLSPWQAGLEACRPYASTEAWRGPLGNPISVFLLGAVGISVVLNLVAVARVRAWNVAREDRPPQPAEEGDAEGLAGGPEKGDRSTLPYSGPEAGPASRESHELDLSPFSSTGRRVWDNPVLWREVRTWAYGRRMLVLRLAYLLVFAVAAGSLYWMMRGGQPLGLGQGALALLPIVLLSLVLVNAQAVTALTAERDTRALDLLLVTDLTAKEIVFGKLGGVFYNTKEMVVLPLVLCGWLGLAGAISLENLAYLAGGLAVLYVFVAVLGIHAGMTYENSRSAVATSLGTVFFLLLGVAACMRIMVAFSGSFNAQLQPFLAFMVGGGVGLYVALGAKNPSAAIALASAICPFATFYAITSFVLGSTLTVFLVTAATYGFAAAAMLIPAIYEFDVATGRTTAEEGGME